MPDEDAALGSAMVLLQQMKDDVAMGLGEIPPEQHLLDLVNALVVDDPVMVDDDWGVAECFYCHGDADRCVDLPERPNAFGHIAALAAVSGLPSPVSPGEMLPPSPCDVGGSHLNESRWIVRHKAGCAWFAGAKVLGRTLDHHEIEGDQQE